MRIPLSVGAAVAVVAGAFVAGPAAAAPGDTIYALTSDNAIVSFAPGSPGSAGTPMPITGLNAGETVLGIDFRPATNQLYAVGSSSQLYTINTSTGAATKVGSPFTPAINGMQVGFDFNPTVDRIRLITDSGQNLRLHPDTGAVVAVDGSLAYTPGDTNATAPQAITAAGYTNSDNDPATGTTLFDIDSANSTLVRQDPPNDGVLNTVGMLGVTTAQQVAFDIGPMGAYMANRPTAADGSRLYRVDLATGAATEVGSIGNDLEITGLAIYLDAAPAPATPTPTQPSAPMPPNTGDAGLVDATASSSFTPFVIVLGAMLIFAGGSVLYTQRQIGGNRHQ